MLFIGEPHLSKLLQFVVSFRNNVSSTGAAKTVCPNDPILPVARLLVLDLVHLGGTCADCWHMRAS